MRVKGKKCPECACAVIFEQVTVTESLTVEANAVHKEYLCRDCNWHGGFEYLLEIEGPRNFHLVRHEDKSGVSGTGKVAVGVKFPTGKCVMEWLVAGQSMSIYDSIEVLENIHGHEGKTAVVWE